MKLEGKICVITGAASGMGRALAIQLAKKEKASGVAICDVNQKELEETARLAATEGVKITTAIVDVSNKDQVYEWKDQIVKDFGGCDVLFNNAGINANGRMLYGPNDDPAVLEKMWDRCFNIDFFGVLYCCRAFLPVLVSRKEAYLINTSSVNGFYTWPEHSAYTAAKHAVKGLTDSIMIECKVKAPHVKVAVLHPGGVRTNIAHSTLHEANLSTNPNAARLAKGFELIADLSSEDAADWIIGAVKKDQYRVLVGYDAWFFDLMVRMFPTRWHSFYEQVGKEGFSVDIFDPENRNEQLLTPGSVWRVFAAGFWTHILFFAPMPLFKLRHYFLGRLALYGMTFAVFFAFIAALVPKGKL